MQQTPPPGKRLARLLDVDMTGVADGYVSYWHAATNTIRFKAGGVGDMLKSTYDPDADGKVEAAVNADQLGGQPSSYYRNASNLNAGTVAAERLSGVAIQSALGPVYVPLAGNVTVGGFLVLDDELVAGDITSRTMFSGPGTSITALNASALSVGIVPTARLGSGSASSSTYLRGDNTWAAIAAAIGGTLGSVDNCVPRANGAGGDTAQGSDICIDDAATATQNNVAIKNGHAGQTNSALVLTPLGNGALIAGPKPDGTATGGNARGAYAVDLQIVRGGTSPQARVASGIYSALGGGSRNEASGEYSCVPGGYSNRATGNFASLAAGYGATASGDFAMAFGNSPTASHSGSFVIGLDSSSGPSSDRAEQLKVKGDGGWSHQNVTGTCTWWGKWTSAPVTGIQAGDFYYDTGTNKMRCYNGSTWNDLF